MAMAVGSLKPPPVKPPTEMGTPELDSLVTLLPYRFVIQTFPSASTAMPIGLFKPPLVYPPVPERRVPELLTSDISLKPGLLIQTLPEPSMATTWGLLPDMTFGPRYTPAKVEPELENSSRLSRL